MSNLHNDFGLEEYLHSLIDKDYEVRCSQAGGVRIIDAIAPTITVKSASASGLSVDDKVLALAMPDLSLAISNGERLLGVRRVFPGVKLRKLAGEEDRARMLYVSSFGDSAIKYEFMERHLIGVYLSNRDDTDGVHAGRSCAEMVNDVTMSVSVKSSPYGVFVDYLNRHDGRETLEFLCYDLPGGLKPKIVISNDRYGGDEVMLSYPYPIHMVRGSKDVQNIMRDARSLSFDYAGRHFSAVKKDGAFEVLIREDGSNSFEQVTAQLEVSAEANAAMYAAAMSADRWLDVPRSGIVQAFSIRQR